LCYKECTEFDTTLVFSYPNTWQYFASYFKGINFSVCGPYNWASCGFRWNVARVFSTSLSSSSCRTQLHWLVVTNEDDGFMVLGSWYGDVGSPRRVNSDRQTDGQDFSFIYIDLFTCYITLGFMDHTFWYIVFADFYKCNFCFSLLAGANNWLCNLPI